MSGKFLSMDYKVISMNREIQYEKFFTMSVKDTLTEQQVALYVKPLYAAEGFHKVYEATKKKKMLPYVASMLRKANIEADKWAEIQDFYADRNSKVIRALNDIYREAYNLGVKTMFVSENFGALLSSGRCLSLFASGDVDNSADVKEKELIYEAFRKLGYRWEEDYTGNILSSTCFYNPQRLPENFYTSVCWEPLSRKKLPCFIERNLFANPSKFTRYSDTFIRLASPEALLYICLMHISIHTYNRLPAVRLYADILNCCCAIPDWQRVLEWAKTEHTVTRLVASAYLANQLADVQIPDEVLSLRQMISVKKILRIAYDEENQCLRPEPNAWGVYKLEIESNDRGAWYGLYRMIFPEKKWIKRKYGNTIIGYCKHIKRLL